ncbi:MAG TPA: hypothetical protein VF006_24155 [Longimicrobium sp.]
MSTVDSAAAAQAQAAAEAEAAAEAAVAAAAAADEHRDRVEEYKTLREETLKRVEIRNQIINLALIATGALLTVGAGQNGPRTALLVYPVIGLFFAAGYCYNYILLVEIGRYLREVLEGAGDTKKRKVAMKWATELKPRHDRFRWIDYAFSFGPFVGTQVLMMVVHVGLVGLQNYSRLDRALLELDLACLAATVLLLVHATRYDPEQGAAQHAGALTNVLRFKIAVTAGLWCIPLLLVPGTFFTSFGFPAEVPVVLVRLLGAAYLALLVAYVGGLRAVRDGKSAGTAVGMGLVSNGAACILLLGYGLAGDYAGWGGLAQAYMWASAAAAGLVTLGLASFGRQ